MFNNPEIRIHGTGSLFPIGQEDLLFHPRMIRTAGRGPGSQANGSFPKGTGRLSEKSPARYPHLTIGTTPPGARASRPHAVPSVAAQFPCDVAADRPAGGNRMGPAEAGAGRRCRLIPVEEMAEAAIGFVRAGRPRSRVGMLPLRRDTKGTQLPKHLGAACH